MTLCHFAHERLHGYRSPIFRKTREGDGNARPNWPNLPDQPNWPDWPDFGDGNAQPDLAPAPTVAGTGAGVALLGFPDLPLPDSTESAAMSDPIISAVTSAARS